MLTKDFKITVGGINLMKNRNCEECDDHSAEIGGVSLKERMWSAMLQDKKILINSEINEDLIEKAVIQMYSFNQVDDANQSIAVGYVREPIIIFLNSGGGLLDEAFSLISAIQSSKTPVITVALGKCASAALLILLAGHARYAQQYSQLMYHQGSAGISGEFNRIQEYARHWEKCQNIVEEYVMKQTKIRKKKLQEVFFAKQDWYLTSKEALELGIIHGIWN